MQKIEEHSTDSDCSKSLLQSGILISADLCVTQVDRPLFSTRHATRQFLTIRRSRHHAHFSEQDYNSVLVSNITLSPSGKNYCFSSIVTFRLMRTDKVARAFLMNKTSAVRIMVVLTTMHACTQPSSSPLPRSKGGP